MEFILCDDSILNDAIPGWLPHCVNSRIGEY